MSGEAGHDGAFSRRGALVLVGLGAALFVALLWMIGAGMTGGPTNDGGAHAGGKGLNGYAAFADYLDRRGLAVRQVRDAASLAAPGLLVLTPPAVAEGKELSRIVNARRSVGPTLVILPKWQAVPVPPTVTGGKSGWVFFGGARAPVWPGFYDDLAVALAPVPKGEARWVSDGLTGSLPAPEQVLSGRGTRLVPIAASISGGRTLAGYIQDDGMYPELENIAIDTPGAYGDDTDTYPVVFVFEPDLVNNYGMAREENARFAERLVHAMAGGSAEPVMFDLTLNGFARSANLLTLAFTPPFLAATLCLLMAALAVGWRAFLRFGPPRRESRAIAFGKRALVANSAGLIERSRRLHLVGAPYAAAARERLAHALAIGRTASPDDTDAAIDRALAARGAEAPHFRELARRLASERDPHRLVAEARKLHALERTLTR